MDEVPPKAEHESIATSLEVEQLDKNLFRSRTLYVPLRRTEVFGGQVISQAVVAASNCVDPAFTLHSLHCYFLLSASPSVPVLYYVDRLREGRSYTTRSVKAVQNGNLVFTMACSFQKPEPQQPLFQRTIPSVPSPNACVLVEDALEEKLRTTSGLTPELREIIQENIAERLMGPIAIKDAPLQRSSDGTLTHACWMRAKSIPRYELHFQKCILSYMSDLRFLAVAATELGLSRQNEYPKKLGMTTTLDHSIWFYSGDFDVGDWMLYVVNCIAAGNGRSVVFGQWYTQAGNLVAVCTQEGVVRAAKPSPKL